MNWKKGFSKILKLFKRYTYSIPFGMKGGDDLLKSQNTLSNNRVSSECIINTSTLGEDLIKGEVTQQVEELRYMDYAVSKEAKKYQYIGDGKAIKKDINQHNLDKYSFSQANKIICEGVLDELQRIGEYGKDRYVMKVITNDVPRFKIESYCNNIEVLINQDEAIIKLHFSTYADVYNPSSRMFNNEIDKLLTFNNLEKIRQSEFNNINYLSFTTYKAHNEDDFINYQFNNLLLIGIDKFQHEYVITYKAMYFKRQNLLDVFYSKTMDEKYRNKETKNNSINPFVTEKQHICEICGDNVNKYDANIVKGTYGKVLCIKCLEKQIYNDIQINN